MCYQTILFLPFFLLPFPSTARPFLMLTVGKARSAVDYRTAVDGLYDMLLRSVPLILLLSSRFDRASLNCSLFQLAELTSEPFLLGEHEGVSNLNGHRKGCAPESKTACVEWTSSSGGSHTCTTRE